MVEDKYIIDDNWVKEHLLTSRENPIFCLDCGKDLENNESSYCKECFKNFAGGEE